MFQENSGFANFFWWEKSGLYHDFFSKSLSRGTKKFRKETLLCFRKLRLSEKFMDKRRGGCITIFCQSLCLTVPKKFVWQPFSVSEKIGCRKNLRTLRGFHYFLLAIFCLRTPKNFVGKHFGDSENFWFRKFSLIREVGVYHDIFSSHSIENFRTGTLLCFRKNRVSKNLMHKNGTSLNSFEKILSHSA